MVTRIRIPRIGRLTQSMEVGEGDGDQEYRQQRGFGLVVASSVALELQD